MLTSGCIYVPDALTRSYREESAVAVSPTITPGQTTKDDILLALGEPDEISPDGSHLVYRWQKVKFLLGFGPAPAPLPLGKNYWLIVTFDQNGVVTGHEITQDWWMIPFI